MTIKTKQEQQVDELLNALKEWDQSADGNTNNTGYPYLADTITLSSSNYNYANTTVAANGPFTISSGTGISSPWAATSTQASGTVSAKDFLIDGELSLREVLEQRLNCLIPNPELEKEWRELKELGDRYRELEKDLQEKAKMWRALNK